MFPVLELLCVLFMMLVITASKYRIYYCLRRILFQYLDLHRGNCGYRRPILYLLLQYYIIVLILYTYMYVWICHETIETIIVFNRIF